jgi:hypothetical protein
LFIFGPRLVLMSPLNSSDSLLLYDYVIIRCCEGFYLCFWMFWLCLFWCFLYCTYLCCIFRVLV